MTAKYSFSPHLTFGEDPLVDHSTWLRNITDNLICFDIGLLETRIDLSGGCLLHIALGTDMVPGDIVLDVFISRAGNG